MDDRIAVLTHDQLLELLARAEIGVRGQVDLDQLALGLADRGEIVVCRQGRAHLRRTDVERRQAVGLEPDAHGEGPRPEDIGALHALERRQPRLHDAHDVVGDFVLLEELRGEAQVGGGELAVGRLDVDDRHLRFRRQVAANLVDLGSDLGQRLGGVVVEAQPRADGRDALRALRFDVVDAVRRGDDALERSRHEASHQVGVGADVDGGDGDRRVLAAGVLAHVQRSDRLHAGDHDDQVDDQGEDRPFDE